MGIATSVIGGGWREGCNPQCEESRSGLFQNVLKRQELEKNDQKQELAIRHKDQSHQKEEEQEDMVGGADRDGTAKEYGPPSPIPKKPLRFRRQLLQGFEV